MIPAEIQTRRDVVEFVVAVTGRPPLRSSGHGDPFEPMEVTFRFASDRSATPGALLMPVTVAGPAVAATLASDRPWARRRIFYTAGDLPPWVLEVANWTKTQPRSR